MTKKEKMELLADALEVEVEEIVEDNLLEDYETWDSVAILCVISIMNDKFNKFPHASDISKFKTVSDILNYMEK